MVLCAPHQVTGFGVFSTGQTKWRQSLSLAGHPLVRTNDGPFLSLMDGIFLRALRGHFHQAPSWFLRLSRALTGDEFAKFMMGKSEFLALGQGRLGAAESPLSH